jgi:hypothetical protein
LLGSKADCNISRVTAHALYCLRTRSIETFTQTVTEVWVGNYVSKVIVTDTAQRFQAKQAFDSTHSMQEPCTSEFTAAFTQIQREYPHWSVVISGSSPKA